MYLSIRVRDYLRKQEVRAETPDSVETQRIASLHQKYIYKEEFDPGSG